MMIFRLAPHAGVTSTRRQSRHVQRKALRASTTRLRTAMRIGRTLIVRHWHDKGKGSAKSIAGRGNAFKVGGGSKPGGRSGGFAGSGNSPV